MRKCKTIFRRYKVCRSNCRFKIVRSIRGVHQGRRGTLRFWGDTT